MLCPHCDFAQPLPDTSAPSPPERSEPAARQLADVPSNDAPVVGDSILITRRQLTAIGGLLIGTGLIAFGLGWMFGRGSGGSIDSGERGPVTLSGRVRGIEGESIAFCFSASNLPERKQQVEHATVEQLLQDKSISQSLQQIDAKLVRIDQARPFQFEMPSAGQYFVLVLSDRRGRNEQMPDTQTLAQVGRYFLRGDQLLGRFRWAWVSVELESNQEITIDLE